MMYTKERVKPPRSLRTARLSVVKNKISTPISLPVAPNAVLVAPKKVIKALYDYRAQSPHEVSFSRGDFFHVISRENDPKWYEVSNPATNARGLVPVKYFQTLERNEGSSTTPSHHKADSGFVDHQQQLQQQQQQQQQQHEQDQASAKKMQPLYGVVLYDFDAERSDELDAKAGEPIIVIAKSNEEWFVAKPIGRLGGPGLIPVSFVEIRDAVTGRAIHSGQASAASLLPVDEWKKMTQGYEATSITLGAFDKPSSAIPIVGGDASLMATTPSARSDRLERHDLLQQPPPPEHQQHYDYAPMHGQQQQQYDNGVHYSQPAPSPAMYDSSATVKDASIDSYILEGDQYWFIVYADLSNGRHRVLYRLYEEFHEFQINLLRDFPVEAGKHGQERILPYMPGPMATINDEITTRRQKDLDVYCKELLSLPREIAESELVQHLLFGLREGDIEIDYDPRTGMLRPNGLDSPSRSSLSTPVPTKSSTGTTIKVKIIHQDDIFAIKVPVDCTLEGLQDKIVDRLCAQKRLQYKAGSDGAKLPLETETDMERAMDEAVHMGKLTVFALSE